MRRDVCAVVGGQFGSEGKGLIVGKIAKEYANHVRVGAANAGHTVWVDGQKYVMQQIPCAAYANPDARLFIGPGAVISPDIFARELDQLSGVYVDERAHVISDEQIELEQQTTLAERIGSTSAVAREGIGQAAADRALRDERCMQAKDHPLLQRLDNEGRIVFWNVPLDLASATGGVLLEGTQGHGLSNTTGYFPYVTSRNTTAAGLCADAGVAPTRLGRVILVVRTYPIRVAGPSGPFAPGSAEINWRDLNVDESLERTTVTKKVRRVATFSLSQVVEAAAVNGATEIALTFADYVQPDLYGKEHGKLDKKLRSMIRDIQRWTGLPVTMLGTSPSTIIRL